jgi:hypothetical protein
MSGGVTEHRYGEIDWNACLREYTFVETETGPPQNNGPVSSSKGNDAVRDFKPARPKKSAGEIIDKIFRKRLRITEKGRTHTVTILEAILRQLYARSLAGDRKALDALFSYSTFGHDNAEGKQRIIAEKIEDDGRYIQDCGYTWE